MRKTSRIIAQIIQSAEDRVRSWHTIIKHGRFFEVTGVGDIIPLNVPSRWLVWIMEADEKSRAVYLREINSGIRKQIRKRDKTKAGMARNAAIKAVQAQRRSFRGKVEELDAAFQALWPEHWDRRPMKWVRGAYIPDRSRIAKRKNDDPSRDLNAFRDLTHRSPAGASPAEIRGRGPKNSVGRPRGRPKGSKSGPRVTARQGGRKIRTRK
jgi:hypothetical protein